MVSVLRFASDLLSRARLANLVGKTFGGKRDLYEALGYARVLTAEDSRQRYSRQGIAARVVEAKPQATWRGGAELVEDEDPNVSTPFEEAFEELDKRLYVWTVFQRADILAGFGRYSVILIGAEGSLETPLPKLRSIEDVLYLACYAEDDATISQWVEDTADPRFGLPLTYQVSKRNSGKKTLNLRVHHSRVVHVADGLLDDRVYGVPRLDRIWNYLDDLDKVSGGGAEAFWIRANQGKQINIDKEMEVDADALKDLKEQAEEFDNGMRRTFTTRGAEVTMLGSDVANFSGPVSGIISLISGATEIPQRILLGSERGELASTQDKSAWDERIRDRRDSFASPSVVRPFVDALINAGALPKPVEYNVRWPEVDELGDAERAAIADTWAGLNGKMGSPVVTASEIRDRVLLLDPLDEQDLTDEAAVIAVGVEAQKAAAVAQQDNADGQAASTSQDPNVAPNSGTAEPPA
jgi:hypothetical protein